MNKSKPEMFVCVLLGAVLILAACSVSIGKDSSVEAATPDPNMDETVDSGETESPDTPVSPSGSDDKSEPVSSDDPVVPAPTFSEEDRARFKEAAYLESIQLLTLESFPVQMHAVLTGNLPDGCTRIAEIAVEKPSDNVFEIHIYTLRPEGLSCTQALVPFEESVALDVYDLPAGEYTVKAYDIEETFTFESANSLE
ncbi:MAG: hypothetical protein JXA25_12630 [Anaerolineales bacterium]|nr:hypothetical protein [Anaerolineales bacterium]